MILGVDTKKLLHFRRLKRLLKLVSPCWSDTLYRPYYEQVKYVNNHSRSTPQVKSDTPIVFPDLELVCRNFYMVGVPCFFAELLRVQARTSCRRKKPGDPNYTMSSVRTTPSILPPDAPPMAPLVATNYETDNVASATSNASGGPGGAHRFVIDASSSHIVVDATINK